MKNQERLAYELGKAALGMSLFKTDPLLQAMLKKDRSLGNDIHNYTLQRAWYEGYLEQWSKVGGVQYERAAAAFFERFHVDIPPETVLGRRYTLFFEQSNTYIGQPSSRHAYLDIWQELPEPVRTLSINAGSFTEALKAGWETIATENTAYLSRVAFLGPLLPTDTGDVQTNLMHRYYNKALQWDMADHKIQYRTLQFRGFKDGNEMILRERLEAKSYRSAERECACAYQMITGQEMPERSRIFAVAVTQDTIRSMDDSPEKEGLQSLIDKALYEGDYFPIFSYYAEGSLPGGGISMDHVPFLEWDLNSDYESIPVGKVQSHLRQIDVACEKAAGGDLAEIDELLETAHDMRPYARHADALIDAECFEPVDAIITGLQKCNINAKQYVAGDRYAFYQSWKANQENGLKGNAGPQL